MKAYTTVCLTAILLLSGCKKPTENVDLILNSELTEATVSLQFVNAQTGEQVGISNSTQQVTLEVLGEDADLVIDNAGQTEFEPDNGFITLGVPSGTVLSNSNPVRFHVVAHAKGYLSTSVPVEMREKGTQHIVIKMVEINNTPDGVAAVTSSGGFANSSGVVASTINLTTPAVNTSHEQTKASVTIPAGTVLMDENMNPVTGTITSTLVYFNNQDETSLASFPGGFSVRTENNENIVFKTGGFVAMEMKNQSGVEVKNFSTPISMTVEIPAMTTNLYGNSISDGMIMPIWSYDPDDGAWKHESDPGISYNGGTGKYEVNFDMIHLSYWNLDWHYPGGCSTGATVNIVSNVTTNKYVSMKLRYPNGQYYGYMGYQNIKNGSTFTFYNAFPNQQMVLEAYSSGVYCSAGVLVSSTNISNLCSGNYTLNYNPTSTTPIIPITVDVNATCANNPGQIIRPSMTIYATEIGSYCWIYVGQMTNGHLSTSVLEQGKTYKFYASYGGYWLEAPDVFTVDQTNYTYNQTLPAAVCSN